MSENEVIVVNRIHPVDYERLIENCVKYAIISLPFTYDRMNIVDIKQRVHNIAKGKIAEALFRFFCEQNQIYADFASCTTNFWETDLRDFVFEQTEWDIKNNFIYHPDELLKKYNYIDLPALVPNRRDGDQWSKKTESKIFGTSGTAFLFTFMKYADLVNGERGDPFLEIHLTTQQQQFLYALYEKYKGYPQSNQPFVKEWFRDEMAKCGEMNFFTLQSKPHLVITGYATEKQWRLFHNTGPNHQLEPYKDYMYPHWYVRSGTGSVNFLNHTYWTTINNATCPVAKLPSFLSLFPKLNDELHCGELLTT